MKTWDIRVKIKTAVFIETILEGAGILGFVELAKSFSFLDWFSSKIFVVCSVLILVVAIFRSWEKRKLKRKFGALDTKVEVRVGDILTQKKGSIAIGITDTFDTELGEIISPKSLLGQFLQGVYEGNQGQLDKDIDREIKKMGLKGKSDKNKVRGKKIRYELGSNLILRKDGVRYFLFVYSSMLNDFSVSTDFSSYWNYLLSFWNFVRSKGELEEINIPVFGSKFSRISGAKYHLILEMILLSYIFSSRNKPVSKKLTILVHEDDSTKVNWFQLEQYLKNL